MATHRRKANRIAIKSNAKRMPMIDWSNMSRNHSTIVKIIKANHDEKEAEEIIRDGKGVYFRIILGDDEFPEPENGFESWFEAMCNETDRQECESIEHLHKNKKRMEKILLQPQMLRNIGFTEPIFYELQTCVVLEKKCGLFNISVLINNKNEITTQVNGTATTNCKYLHQLKRLVYMLSGERLVRI